MSYGSGRPAVLKDDESIWKCRLLLRHPLSIEDDMRLVSTVELMAIRERVNNSLSNNTTGPVDERTFEVLRTADAEFVNWYQTWDQAFSQKYEDAGKAILISNSSYNTYLPRHSLLSPESTDSAHTRRTVPQRLCSSRHRWSRRRTEHASCAERVGCTLNTDSSARFGHHGEFTLLQRRHEIW